MTGQKFQSARTCAAARFSRKMGVSVHHPEPLAFLICKSIIFVWYSGASQCSTPKENPKFLGRIQRKIAFQIHSAAAVSSKCIVSFRYFLSRRNATNKFQRERPGLHRAQLCPEETRFCLGTESLRPNRTLGCSLLRILA